ncbi:MAG: epsF [Sedimentibacter sp.]|jgi:type IV pilus assembly protein PilC|nr:epsF [Sedimentibacter sp.]
MNNTSIKKLSSTELSYFCTQIAMILKSGMLIYDGIEWMYKDIEEGNVKNALRILKDELSSKTPLYKAMENSGYFPSYIINMSEIGSVTGRLDDVMSSLSEYYDRENHLKSKIRNSVFYPAMLFIMMSFIILILVTKIFPIFEEMIQELGGQLSNESSFILSFSTGIMTGKFALSFVLAILFIVGAFYILYKTDNGKNTFNKLLYSNLFTKSIMKKITAYRFASGMSLLLSSGLNAESSINMLLDIVEEPTLKNKIEECMNSMSSGNDFLESASKLSLFSSMHLQMLTMGQRTGEMDVVMKKIANIYESDSNDSINNAVSLIEPILVGTLCVVIGFILISVMLPLMNIMSSIG